MRESREKQIRQADTVKSMAILAGMREDAIRRLPMREGSGLQAWQKIMSRLREKRKNDRVL